MVTKEQFMTGLMNYAESEIIPILPTAGKWGIGTAMVLMANKSQSIINSLITNDMIKFLDVVNNEGLIDIDRLSYALKQSAERYGPLQVNIPIVGSLKFNSEDIDRMKLYIEGGQMQ